MRKVFNTTFEASLRILLLLSISEESMTADRIGAYDFLTIYSGYFGLSEQVMHGENDFGLSEFASRRKSTQVALKSMVLDGMVKALHKQDGFRYAITERGISISNSMQTEYAVSYKKLAKATIQRFSSTHESEIMDVISKTSMKSLRR